MTTFRTVVPSSPLRTTEDLVASGDDKKIIEYLEAHPNDDDAIDTMMKTYRCSRTSVLMLIVRQTLGR